MRVASLFSTGAGSSRKEFVTIVAKAGDPIDVREEFVEPPGRGVRHVNPVFRWQVQRGRANNGVDLVLKVRRPQEPVARLVSFHR